MTRTIILLTLLTSCMIFRCNNIFVYIFVRTEICIYTQYVQYLKQHLEYFSSNSNTNILFHHAKKRKHYFALFPKKKYKYIRMKHGINCLTRRT